MNRDVFMKNFKSYFEVNDWDMLIYIIDSYWEIECFSERLKYLLFVVY